MVFGLLSVGSYVHISILARAFSEADFARWSLFLAGLTMMDGLRSGLVLPWLVRFGQGEEPSAREARQAIGTAVWWLSAGVALVWWLGSQLTAALWQEAVASELLRWFPWAFLVTLPNLLATWQLMIRRDFWRIFLIRVAFLGSFALASVVCFWLGLGIEWALLAYCLTQLLSSVLAWAMGWVLLPAWAIPAFWQAKLRTFGAATTLSGLVGTLQPSLELLTVAWVFPPVLVAYFALTQRAINASDIILRSIMANFFPQAGQLAALSDQKSLQKLFKSYAISSTLIFALMALLVGFSAKWVLLILGGNQYIPAATLLAVMMLQIIIKPLEKMTGSILEITGKPHWQTWLFSAILVITFVSIWLLGISDSQIMMVAWVLLVIKLVHTVFNWWLAVLAMHQYFGTTQSGSAV